MHRFWERVNYSLINKQHRTLREMRKLFLIIIACVFFQNGLFAQEEMNGDLVEYLQNMVNGIPGPGSNDFIEPDAATLDTWNSVITEMVNEDYAGAHTTAQAIDYKVTEFTDDSGDEDKVYYVLQKEENTTDNYWGTYVFNPNAIRKQLIIQAPHPIADINTGAQASYVYKNLDAWSLFISGTHRCNSNRASSCSGTTEICRGFPQSYRISDLAHYISSFFQRGTEVVSDLRSNSVFIQLHGFTKEDTDPALIMSNGTKIIPSRRDYLALLKDELLKIDNLLTFKISHIDLEWTKLVGFNNTQGRYLNESIDVCSTLAGKASGRFLHLEQYDKLRQDQQGWEVLTSALREVFPLDGITTATGEEYDVHKVTVMPNPFSDELRISFGDIQMISPTLTLYNYQGKSLGSYAVENGDGIKVENNLPAGYYYYVIKDETKFVTSGKLIKKY